MTVPVCVPGVCETYACEPSVCRGAAFDNESLFERSRRVIPGAVNSPIRAFGGVGGTPYFVATAEGAYVTDVEGQRYVDLVQSYGAVIAGHAHPKIVEAITAAAADGTSYGAPTAREMKLAEEICFRVPSCQQVRLVNSGTEATMTAIRLARGFTGRPKIVKFAGNYHGHADMLLAAGGSGIAMLGLSGSAGVTEQAVAQTVVAPYNVVPTLDDDVACVIVEPVAANMGLVAAQPGFLEGLRAECDRVGALLVFDEVITGFRVARGGLQQLVAVRPDLTCFGKVIGGGLPIGAFGGRGDVMAALAPVGPVFQAGTLSGNPLATAAGLAALGLLDDEAYQRIEKTATRLADGLRAALHAAGVAVTVPQYTTLLGLHFSPTPAVDQETAKLADKAKFAAFFHAMLRRGIALSPGSEEILFPGLAHDDAAVERVLDAATDAAYETASVWSKTRA